MEWASIVVLAANVYLLAVWLMGRHVFEGFEDRWRALFSLLWPVMFPLFVVLAVVAMLSAGKEK